MALKTNIKINVSCPRHKRYNPESSGEGGIVGGCPLCYSVLRLHQDATRLITSIKSTKNILEAATIK